MVLSLSLIRSGICGLASRGKACTIWFHLHESHRVECSPCAYIDRTRGVPVYSRTRQEALSLEDLIGFFASAREIRGDAPCFSQQNVDKARLRLVHDPGPNEGIGLLPYLGPDLIAAVVKRESASTDLRDDSKSTTENLLSTGASPTINEQPVRVSFPGKAFWLRCSRRLAVAGRLVVSWLI